MTLHPYIAIEGAIGVGKTTLARILGAELPAEVLLEVFEENPFLSDFYADRARYAFQTQLFFLLSRYRQQHRVIASTVSRSGLVSDYLFAKDWLFAHLNLAGDELAMYERVHAILGQQIPAPGLVVYLRASTDTLMRRIAFRDRSYERQMARDYIESLRAAYEAYFASYTAAPVLVLDSDHVDFVRDGEVRAEFVGRIKAALSHGGQQLALLTETPQAPAPVVELGRRLADLQRQQDGAGNAPPDAFMDALRLTAALDGVGSVLAQAWQHQEHLLAQVGNRQEARDQALTASGAELAQHLAGALVSLLRIANGAGVDLERAYLQRSGAS